MATILNGSCACGRNRYLITIPTDTSSINNAQVIFNNSSHSRRLQASPLTAFLKIPLTWFQSSTIAYRTDETHQSIRRTFSSPIRDHLRNQFCGYCGTQLSQLDDSSREEDAFISLTLGSLIDEDLDRLGDLGLLDGVDNENEGNAIASATPVSGTRQIIARSNNSAGLHNRGAPWFEDLVEDSPLGRIRRQKGGQASQDGSVVYEWEVVEWSSADQDTATKRKISDVEGSPEMEMTG